jgi:hypothetical protein
VKKILKRLGTGEQDIKANNNLNLKLVEFKNIIHYNYQNKNCCFELGCSQGLLGLEARIRAFNISLH